ncbi:hypothetical protein PIB30_063496 [Stylosanthes scabra]|uniref:Uncharacterized protein n=1 Tax=Stylosanthes scabra TaxID=79078 RepID=A0ABU6QLV8_9FABA|nr:hypothetical protein [Stylosanthes scabra]
MGPQSRRVTAQCVEAAQLHVSDYQMVHKGKEVASASTPSRSRTTKNSNRGRDEGFPAERFDSQIHYDRWKTMEHRGITHERNIHLQIGSQIPCVTA